MRGCLAAPAALAVASVAAVAPAPAAGALRATWASWYGPGLFGNPLGCQGEGRLWSWTRGVAHRTLDCGTRVRICATRCRTARVIDRGPFVDTATREFDLTQSFAGAVGLRVGPRGAGRIYVRVIR